MKRVKLIFAAMIVFIVAGMVPDCIYGMENLDLTKKGNISVNMKDGDAVVAGGSLIIYDIAGIGENNGTCEFVYREPMKACEESLEDIQSEELAAKLMTYVENNDITGHTQTIDANGSVVFSDLEAGLYLIVQKEAANGYYAINPFLVSLPVKSDGQWSYEVDASPKIELKRKTSDEPKKTTNSSGKTSSRSSLPKTGLVNWPIPVMAISGLLLFTIGWWMCFTARKKYD